MSVIYRDLFIDCTRDNEIYETVTSNEHGVTVFRLTLFNNNIPIDISSCTDATYYGIKPDGHTVGIACDLIEGKVLLPLRLQMTTSAGVLNGIIELKYTTGNVRFYGVNFKVLHSPEADKVESTDDFTILEKAIDACENAIARAKSAYQIAVENGFEGTVEDWLESLKGKDGIGITSTEINTNGELVLTYADGTSSNVGIVKGKDGTDYVLTESDKQEIAKLVEASSGSSDKWEIINTVKVNEEVNVVSITQDQSGNPFKLKKIRILGKIMPCVDQNATNYLALGLNSNISNVWWSYACKFGESPIATDTCENFILIGEIVRGYFSLLECRHSYTKTNVTTLLSKSTAVLNYPEEYQIGDAIIIGSYLRCIGIGSTFKIWGVKDNE